MTTSTKKDSKKPIMKLLPRELWDIKMTPIKLHIIAGIYEHPPGCMYYHRYCLSDFPNNLISFDDLKRFGINLVDLIPCASHPF